MEIISFPFAAFVIAALLIYLLLPKPVKNAWLLLVSYFFVATWGILSAVLLGLISLWSFFIAKKLAATEKHRRFWMLTGITINFVPLIYYRLIGSPLLASFIRIARLEAFIVQTEFTGLLIQIGLAYYVLQASAYVIGVYHRKIQPETSPINFALYLAYFPKFLSGPIERPQVFLAQLSQRRVASKQNFINGLTLILIGLGRKIVVADLLTKMLPNYLWGGTQDNYYSVDLWLWLLALTFTLYNDFTGYTSIVRGISLLFGLELSSNFSQPFFARTFSEFWSRWHISLSMWLRDHVYFPVSRQLRNLQPRSNHWINIIVPPMITMLISGLWHGFSATMLVWGGLHGLYQVIERIILLKWPLLKPSEGPWWRQILAGVLVFLLTTLAWVPFFTPLINGNLGALNLWKALLIYPNWSISDIVLMLVLIPMLLSLWLDWMQYRGQNELVFLKWPKWSQAILLSSAVLLITVFSITNTGRVFIYQGF